MAATSKRPSVLVPPPVEPLDARGARVAALDALARRDHAAGDLRRKLLKKGYDAGIVDPLLDVLRAEKLLDDARYMENFVAYHAARGQGPLRVRAELKSHHIEGAAVEEYLSAYPDWILYLRKAQGKKFGGKLPTTYADRQRQARFLGYRGYTGAQIRTALGFDVELDAESKDL